MTRPSIIAPPEIIAGLRAGQREFVVAGEPFDDLAAFMAEQGLPDPTFVAPSEWVALTGPCEKCQINPDHAAMKGGASDCKDGRKLIEIRETCSVCANHGIDPPMPGHYNPLVATATVEVLPVVDFGGWEITARPVPCVTVDDYDQCVHMIETEGLDGAHGEPLTLDPLPQAGRDFVLVFDNVEMAS